VADPPEPTESAVLVPVPEAERVVSRHRARLDAAAGLGVPAHVTVLFPFVPAHVMVLFPFVPAHVTVLFPFVPPSEIAAATLESLAAAVASVDAFDCEFPDTAWFGSDVLWLAPRPDEPFRTLTRVVTAAFPGYRPTAARSTTSSRT
jgi:2'-5' RNA ligase superfamily